MGLIVTTGSDSKRSFLLQLAIILEKEKKKKKKKIMSQFDKYQMQTH